MQWQYDGNNRRTELRLTGRVAVFVETRAASPDGSSPAEVLACSGIDLSAGGLQLRLDRQLPVGSILRLGADLREHGTFYVVGEVRWSRAEGAGWATGFALFDSDGTDIVAWKELIAARLGS